MRTAAALASQWYGEKTYNGPVAENNATKKRVKVPTSREGRTVGQPAAPVGLPISRCAFFSSFLVLGFRREIFREANDLVFER